MRRALFLVSVFALGLAATGSAAIAAEAPIRNPEFTFVADGFNVTVESLSESDEAMLTLYRGGQAAIYKAPAEITESTIKARFGGFGELDYTFTPGVGKRPRCEGGEGTTEGTFAGSFDFTGENHYVSFEVGHAHGSFTLFPEAGCEEPPKSSKPPKGKAKAGGGEDGAKHDEAKEATLDAIAFGGRRATYVLAFPVPDKPGKALISAFRAEQLTGGLVVERGATVLGGGDAFSWDLGQGTAHLAPPAPFAGSAVFERPHGKSIWRGSLRVPLLGGKPVRLTGKKFRATLGAGSLLG